MLAFFLVGCAAARHDSKAWEYKRVFESNYGTIDQQLNQLGAEGWQLVTEYETPSHPIIAVLKRAKR